MSIGAKDNWKYDNIAKGGGSNEKGHTLYLVVTYDGGLQNDTKIAMVTNRDGISPSINAFPSSSLYFIYFKSEPQPLVNTKHQPASNISPEHLFDFVIPHQISSNFTLYLPSQSTVILASSTSILKKSEVSFKSHHF
jgi:hypothetical protein